MRVDIWVWVARMVRTRSQATTLCKAGKVTVNDIAAKPARQVVSGDIVSVTINRRKKIYRVCALAERRGPASEAVSLFEDLTPAPDPRELAGSIPVAKREQGTGRPTKKDRRALERLRSK